MPGMLYARILRPPAHGATRKRVDTSGAKQMLGVLVVEEGDLIAVLHEHPDTAEKALAKIRAEFEPSKSTLDHKNIFDHLLQVAPAGTTVKEGGSLEKGRSLAAEIFETTYFNGYVAHAPMETHTALAEVKDGKATVWASTQTPFGVRDQVAGALGFSPANVRVKPVFVGGGFGGKSASGQAVEAARLAKSTRETGAGCLEPWGGILSRHLHACSDCENQIRRQTVPETSCFGIMRFILQDRTVPSCSTTSLTIARFPAGAGRAPAALILTAQDPGERRRRTPIPLQENPRSMSWRPGPGETRSSIVCTISRTRGCDACSKPRRRSSAGHRPKPPAAGVTGWRAGFVPGPTWPPLQRWRWTRQQGRFRSSGLCTLKTWGWSSTRKARSCRWRDPSSWVSGMPSRKKSISRTAEILDLNFDTYQIPRFSWMPEIETVLIEGGLPPQGGGEPANRLCGRGDRQCHLRCRRREGSPFPHDTGKGPGDAQEKGRHELES